MADQGTECCETCRFWRAEPGNSVGSCQRYAPAPTLASKTESLTIIWPETHENECCGEYQPATGAPPRNPAFDPNEPITGLGLVPLTRNALKRAGIETLGQLLAYSEEELLCLNNIGPITLGYLRKKLALRGFALGLYGTPPTTGA